MSLCFKNWHGRTIMIGGGDSDVQEKNERRVNSKDERAA